MVSSQCEQSQESQVTVTLSLKSQKEMQDEVSPKFPKIRLTVTGLFSKECLFVCLLVYF